MKQIMVGIFIFLLSYSFIYSYHAADSRDYPVTAVYCDGSTLEVYPFSLVTRDDGSTFNCYDVMVSTFSNGYQYGFEDKDDGDYNDLIIQIWVSGNDTSAPVVHVKYISKEATYKHWLYVVYSGMQQLVFMAEDASPGAIFDIPLPVKDCRDFEINAEPPLRTIDPGDSTHYTVTIKALNGFTDDVNLEVEGLPVGASGVFQPNPLPITGEAKLDITTTPQVAAGTYTLTIKGTAAEKVHTAQVTLEIREKQPEADFTLEAEPLEQSLYPGESVEFKLKLTSINGFSNPVKLYIEGLPEGGTADFRPGMVKPSGESKLTISTSAAVPVSTYKLRVSARGGGIKRNIDITLTVKEKPPDPDFDIKAEPAVQTLYRGESTDYTITITALNGFSSEVSLQLTGVPAGTTASFSDAALTPSGETQLQMVTTAGTPVGDHTLTITGSGGGKEHSTSVKLSVVCRDFSVQIKANPAKGPAPLTVQFEALVNGTGELSAGDYSYSWNFGEGNTSDQQNPEHTFQAPGDYQVVLSVTDGCGKSKTAAATIEAVGFAGVISKSFSVSEALPGDEVFINIEVKNETPFNFSNLTIRDELSPYLEYLEDDAPVSPQRSGRELVWQFRNLEKGETLRFNVKVKVTEDAPSGTITNKAFLTHDSLGEGKRLSSNTASLQVRNVDVLLQKQVEQTTAKPGDIIKYQLIVKNNSDIPLTGIELTDELSTHLEYDYQAGALEFSRQGRFLQWTGTIEAGHQEVIIIKARVKHDIFSGTRIRNQARLEAAELKAALESNTVETSISSEPVSTTNVRFTKRSEVPQTEVGKIIRFNITVANMSNSSLISPLIEDYLPQGFSYVAFSTLLNNQRFTEPQGKRRLLWNFPHIKPGETLVLRYQVVIGADAKRGRNINRATLRATDNSGQEIFLEASAFVNVSTTGFIFYSGVEGTVYLDRDDDDFYSMADTPLQGIEVRLSTGEKAITDPMGHYMFESLYPGEYAVGVNRATLPERYKLSLPYPKVVVLADGLTDTVDFAVKFQGDDEVGTARLQGRVFYDKNQDKVFDGGDPLAETFTARLDGILSTTGKDGMFVFTHLKPGTHTIKIIYGPRTVEKEITLKQGKNYIDIPLIFSGIKIIIKGEEQ